MACAAVDRTSRTWLILAGTVLVIVAAGAAALLLRRRSERTFRELVPTRVTSNNSDAVIQSMALSPDGKYLAYSDINGVHVRSIGTADSRVLPDTKGMIVQYWAADATQFFVAKPGWEHYIFYSVPMPGGIPHALGDSMPSPGGQYSVSFSLSGHEEVRRATDGKVFSLDRENASLAAYPAWSTDDKRLAVAVSKLGGSRAYWIEAFDPENGRWTTLVSSQREYISGVAWVSDRELIYAKKEPAPRADSNLWVVDVNPSTGLPSGAAQRRTHWTDFRIQDEGFGTHWTDFRIQEEGFDAEATLSASANGSRLCFTRSSLVSNLYVGDLQAHGTRLASLRQLSVNDAANLPFAWTSDTKAVLLQSNRDGQFHIYKQDINRDTADLITSGSGSQTAPRVSSDGRWVLYLSHDDTPGGAKARLLRIPLTGGTAQEVLSSYDLAFFMCSATPEGACVLTETRQNAKISSMLDPIKGRGRKLLETTGDAGDPAISPDGQHIAFVVSGGPQNRIRILNLHGAIEHEITISGAQYLASLDWSADGTGFFTGDIQSTTTRLLHVERDGASEALWTQPTRTVIWGIPSPDGRHLATFKTDQSANVWMVARRKLSRRNSFHERPRKLGETRRHGRGVRARHRCRRQRGVEVLGMEIIKEISI